MSCADRCIVAFGEWDTGSVGGHTIGRRWRAASMAAVADMEVVAECA